VIFYARIPPSGEKNETRDRATRLGTERFRTTNTGAVCESIASLPFGDGQTTTANCYQDSPLHFTGKERDSESGLDYFGARYDASSMGRFMSPDPANIAGDLDESGDPQSWNAYSYVANNPLNATDPDGLDCVYTSQHFGNTGAVALERGSCTEKGGTYVPGTVDQNSFRYNSQTGSLGFTYTPYSGGAILGVGNITGIFPSGGVSDADRLNALGLAGQMAAPGVNLAANGLRAFGYAVAAPLMVAAECAAGADSCTKGNVAMAILPEVGALREGALLLKEGAAVGKAAEILQKGGGAAQAAKDFDSLQGAEKVLGSTKVKTLANGTKAVLYNSTSGGTSIALQDAAGRTVTKIRY